MIRIEREAWAAIAGHARGAYPDECCGAMLGRADGGATSVSVAVPLENTYEGPQRDRYRIRPEDLLAVDRQARGAGLELIGIYHSHPDCDAYFSKTDLENSCPWYSFLVVSVRGGRIDHANCWRANADQTAAEPEELAYPALEEAASCQRS
jgi:proteasome lid subunit RPN8/RPN11